MGCPEFNQADEFWKYVRLPHAIKGLYLKGIMCCYSILFNRSGSLNIHTVYIQSIFNSSILRALAGIGIGLLIADIIPRLSFGRTRKEFLFYSLLEIGFLSYILGSFLFRKEISYLFPLVVAFCGLFVCFVNSLGFISSKLNSFSWINKYSKYAYCIYLSQYFAVYYLKGLSPWVYLTSGMFLTLICGVVLHHLVEKRFVNYEKKIPLLPK